MGVINGGRDFERLLIEDLANAGSNDFSTSGFRKDFDELDAVELGDGPDLVPDHCIQLLCELI